MFQFFTLLTLVVATVYTHPVELETRQAAPAAVAYPAYGAGTGTPGAGTPGAGTPGAGTPGAGTPGAGTPGAGTPGAGTPGAGTPGGASPAPVFNTTADLAVLQYALTLENLEAAFYTGALNRYTQAQFLAAGLTANDYIILTEVRNHESTHVTALSAAISGLGATPVPPCVYKFPDMDPISFLGIARALEKTGVSAYSGAAAQISSPGYLTVAATILSIEARHAAFFNYIQGKSPAPQPFDIPLDMRQIVSIASQFIVSCPYTLPATFPSLAISPAMGNGGMSLKLTTTAATNGANCAFLTGSGTNWLVPVDATGSCTVPAALVGDVYIVLTSAASLAALNDGNTLAGPANFIVPDAADNNIIKSIEA